LVAADAAAEGDVPLAMAMPDGGICGLMPGGADPLLPSDDAFADSSDGAVSACLADAGASAFAPPRPLGVGYPDGNDLLPAKTAYLTFDDGPSDWTPDFLDVLKSKSVRATFFVNAKNFKGSAGLDGTYVDGSGNMGPYRDLLKREVDDGHVIANHTVNHPDLAGITEEQVQSELDENELLMNIGLVRAGGTPHLLTLFRPPYGSPWYHGKVLLEDAGPARTSIAKSIALHGIHVMWTIDSTDSREWAQDESFTRAPDMIQPTQGAPTYADKMVRIKQTVLSDASIALGQGVIILMHDTHDTTRDVLGDLIDGLSAAGYSFATIEDYVQWRWRRPSIDLTPGPALYAPCVDERNWGCAAIGAPVGTDRAHEVCGRMWRAYEVFGGTSALGAPVSAPMQSPSTGIMSQRFERAIVELHPENPAPCDIILIPQ
jgi:peptidoglycan/xylan/chitin deacetylase (PgdA/CDA1 family)